jgi:hypothetical protein
MLRKKSLIKTKIGRSNSKYGNIITVLEGIKFDSKAESIRYSVLCQQQECGVISDLKLQQTYQLTIEGKKFANYIADFVYTYNGKTVVEDVKNPALDTGDSPFSLKKRAMKILYDIDVRCIHPSKVMVF